MNLEIDYVEVFSTASMRKVAELYTGAFPRAVTSWGDRVVVVAADSTRDSRLSGFAVLYDGVSLTPLSTHRLVGTPTNCATIDPTTGALYVAVNNPYDIRDRFGDRQDLQVVFFDEQTAFDTTSLTAPVVNAPTVVSDPLTVTVADTAAASGTNRGLGAPFTWSPPTGVPHEMVLVPAGKFIMGSDDGDSDEQPTRVVDLDAYFIDAFEVTVEQYRSCVDAGTCAAPISASLCNWYTSVPDNHPINCMYWNDADTYCRWAELRLPTEAEWEKAARGVDQRTFPWGEDFDRGKANYGDGGIMRTTPVDAYPDGVSPYGAWDMAGNVFDWVDDWYHEHHYSNAAANNPVGPESGSLRVLRGGSHWFDASLMRSSNREPYHPQQTDVDIGFRCARDGAAVPAPQRR
jgi:formylglycine-generating enzyme required for sulfatase activity